MRNARLREAKQEAQSFSGSQWKSPDSSSFNSAAGPLLTTLHWGFSAEGDSPCGGHLVMSRNNFGGRNHGRGYYWRLVGRGQGCCSIFYNAQEAPCNRVILAQKSVKSAKVGNPCSAPCCSTFSVQVVVKCGLHQNYLRSLLKSGTWAPP